MKADFVLSRLERVRPSGPNQWMARCPAHPDRNPSLSVRMLDDGNVLLYDFGGCDFLSISRALRLGHGDPQPFDHVPQQATPGNAGHTFEYAQSLWSSVTRADETVGAHAYARRKGIRHAYGAGRVRASGRLIGRNADVILVPIRMDGIGGVISVQAINEEGVKQTFGSMGDSFLLLGNEYDSSARWLVVEGWATGHAYSTRWRRTVICVAFGKGRLDRVAERVAAVHAPREIVVLGELDDSH